MPRKTKAQRWSEVSTATIDAKLIAFDGCHKIYLAMDKQQAKDFSTHPSYETFTDKELSPYEMFVQLKEWYEASCMLKFITKVSTTETEDEYISLIPQGV